MRYGETSKDAENEFEDDIEDIGEPFKEFRKHRSNRWKGSCPPSVDTDIPVPDTTLPDENNLSRLARHPPTTFLRTARFDTYPPGGYLPNTKVIMSESTIPRTTGLPRIGILGKKRKN